MIETGLCTVPGHFLFKMTVSDWTVRTGGSVSNKQRTLVDVIP